MGSPGKKDNLDARRRKDEGALQERPPPGSRVCEERKGRGRGCEGALVPPARARRAKFFGGLLGLARKKWKRWGSLSERGVPGLGC